jgi:histidinol-phosphate aminotransferase
MVESNENIKKNKPYFVPSGKPIQDCVNLVINQNYNIHHESINDNNINYYPSRNDNFLLLIKKISEYIDCDENEILLTHGSENGLGLIMQTFCNKETRVLIPFPNYPGLIHKAKLFTDNINFYKFYGNEDEYKEFYDEISNNDIIYISSPNLPLGYEINESIYDIITLYPDKLFILDEAYFEYSSRDRSFYSNKYKNIIIVRTFSKAFALAGARVGYLVTNTNFINLLKVAYSDKDILDYSVDLCLKVLTYKEYYLNQVETDKKNWSNFFQDLKKYIKKNDMIYEYIVGHGPYFLIFTEYPDYVCELFKKNKYLVRNKTDDLNRGCVRISLSSKKIMDDILTIIKKINGYYDKYKIIYFDIDKTIRETSSSPPVKGIQLLIKDLNKTKEVNFITNNISNYCDIKNYLDKHEIYFNKLICPFVNYNITDQEYLNGYFIREDNLYLTKFPNITYELMNHIYTNKLIHIIEEDYTESSKELGISQNDINLPFIGSFQCLLDSHKIKVKYKIIGKKNLYVVNNNDDTLVIGDSNDDLIFALNNDFYFKRIYNCNEEIVDIVSNLLETTQ